MESSAMKRTIIRIAEITDKYNSVTELTSDDLKKIYTGEISNWKDLGGKDVAIVAIGREAASGTRGAFNELYGVEEKAADGNKVYNTTEDASVTNNTSVMMSTVAGNEYAIGYISLGSLNDSVKALAIDGVKPSADAIKDGGYMISRPFISREIIAATSLFCIRIIIYYLIISLHLLRNFFL